MCWELAWPTVRRGAVGGAVVCFARVPYAASSVGDLGFRPPRPPPSWTGVRDAVEHGPVCPQPGFDDSWQPVATGEEACLYLDVVRPVCPNQPGPLPVVVWLHGGYLTTGAGSEYDAARLAVGGN